jgi:hypothetical protein
MTIVITRIVEPYFPTQFLFDDPSPAETGPVSFATPLAEQESSGDGASCFFFP